MKDVIRLLELLHNYRDIQDINCSALLRSTERLAESYKDETFLEAQKEIGYQKWTIAFLKEVLRSSGLVNIGFVSAAAGGSVYG